VSDIRTEFERLKELLSTDEGWEQFDTLWMISSGYTKGGDGRWEKKFVGMGDMIAGFAIDPVTYQFKLGLPSPSTHKRVRTDLWKILMDQKIDEYDRVAFGHAHYLPEWNFPVINIYEIPYTGIPFTQVLSELEERVLELGIGLPIARLFQEKYRAS
jgi:hypothetical protein